MSLRNRCYDSEKLPVRRLESKVVSVGNITVGGTGKTPLVEKIARHLRDKNIRVCVLSRGYKRKSKGSLIVSDGSQIFATEKKAGDEPFLLARRLPGVPIVVDADRYRGGLVAQEQFSPDAILLDDGFQHRGLARDVDIVSLYGSKPFANGRILPAGLLREKPSSLMRADLILLSQPITNYEEINWKSRLSKYGSAPVFTATPCPVSLVNGDGSEDPPQMLNGENIVAFCGIANPQRFLKTLINLGANVLEFMTFPDHHYFSQAQIQKIATTARARKASLIIATEKDWVRLPTNLPAEVRWKFLTIEVVIKNEDIFFDRIQKKCDF